jgi:hypothetical protein
MMRANLKIDLLDQIVPLFLLKLIRNLTEKVKKIPDFYIIKIVCINDNDYKNGACVNWYLISRYQ